MDALKITFANGESVSFPFSAGSTLAVDTPDGVNGSQRGVWGEVVEVEYVKDAVAPAVPVADPAPAAEPEPEQPAADPQPDAPQADPAPEAVTPDPQPADSPNASSEPATTSETSSTDSSTAQDASLTSSPTPTTDSPAA